MPVLLIISSFILLTLIVKSKHQQDEWKSSILSALIFLGLFIAVSTEILSIFKQINLISLLVIWFIFNVFLILIIKQIKAYKEIKKLININNTLRYYRGFNKTYLLGIGIIIFIVLIVGIVAVFTAPNNWDSMAYVMPRITHWIQNSSVDHYPSHFGAQLNNNPFAEFVLLHLQILSGHDGLANIPQWLSMIGCLIGISLITKLFNANIKSQFIASLICVTIPVGILQASNSKNTYITAFWLVCFIYFGILLITRKFIWHNYFVTVISFSLAIFTKGTVYIYALPFICWFVFSFFIQSIKTRKETTSIKKIVGQVFGLLILACGIILIINIGHYSRNFYIFGSPISNYPYKLTNDFYSIPVFISSVIKNISLHLVPPFTSSENIDWLIIQAHNLLSVNPTDPRLNFPEKLFSEFSVNSIQTFEDTAGNFFHFVLSIISIIIVLINRTLRNNRLLLAYVISTTLSFLIFCLILRWQIWHSRLHLPLFILMSPVIGVVLSQYSFQDFYKYILVLLVVCSFPYLFINETRPIIANNNIFNTNRVEQYFIARQTLKDDYLNATKIISKKACRNIGIISRADIMEYPLLVSIKQSMDTVINTNNQQNIRFENVNVLNPSAILSNQPYYREFVPCAVISIGLPFTKQININQNIYRDSEWEKVNSLELIQVFFHQL